MAILDSTSEAPVTFEQITERDFALAAFIMGSLVQAQVIQIGMFDSDAISDFQCGIRIVAACLKGLKRDDDRNPLPFEW